ncbi:MAG: exonuclease domain-containing protein, partial [Myxococcota bacterium]
MLRPTPQRAAPPAWRRAVSGMLGIEMEKYDRAPKRWLLQASLTEERSQALLAQITALLVSHGVEAELRELDPHQQLPWPELRFLALDTETTGLDARDDRIVELSWVTFDRGKERGRFSSLCDPLTSLPAEATAVTGITPEMLQGQPRFDALAPSLLEAISDVDFVVAYHAPFDRGFLAAELRRCGRSLPPTPWIDPLLFVREVDRFKPGKRLEDVTRRWGIAHDRPHRALDDAAATGELLLRVASFLPARTLGA